jgi:hypothetical protein
VSSLEIGGNGRGNSKEPFVSSTTNASSLVLIVNVIMVDAAVVSAERAANTAATLYSLFSEGICKISPSPGPKVVPTSNVTLGKRV